MHPGIRTIVGILAAVTISLTVTSTIGTTAPIGAPSAPGACGTQVRFQPVIIGVPVNGLVSFGIDDLLQSASDLDTCHNAETLGATVAVTQVAEGHLTAITENELAFSGNLPAATAAHFVFTPRRDFSGTSEGWEVSIDAPAEAAALPISLGTVRITFLVRNSLPIASDDEVVVTPGLTQIEVPAISGVLANDTDLNGDRITVHTDGVTRFAWGTVEIRADGSFRITVTQPDRAEEITRVRYVVWDNQGSPTSTDFGTLTIRFRS